MLYLFTFFTLVVFSEAHKMDYGSCPKVTPLDQFEMNQFLGSWYVKYKVDVDTDCVKNTFYVNEKDGLMVDEERYADFGIDSLLLLRSEILPYGKSATMKIKYSSFLPQSTMHVLATDYKNYALIFKCQPLFLVHRWSASILVRDPNYEDNELFADLFGMMTDEGLDYTTMDLVNHEGCKEAEDVDVALTFSGDDFSVDVEGRFVDSIKDTFDALDGALSGDEEVSEDDMESAKEVLETVFDTKDNEILDV